jgi:hypothetical protein
MQDLFHPYQNELGDLSKQQEGEEARRLKQVQPENTRPKTGVKYKRIKCLYVVIAGDQRERGNLILLDQIASSLHSSQ